MVIFHSYVSLPEGILGHLQMFFVHQQNTSMNHNPDEDIGCLHPHFVVSSWPTPRGYANRHVDPCNPATYLQVSWFWVKINSKVGWYGLFHFSLIFYWILTIRFFHDSSVFTVFQEMTKFWWCFLGPLPFIDPQVVSQTSSQWVPMTASWVSGASGDAPVPGETGWGMWPYPQGLAGELRQGNGNAKSELTLIDSYHAHTLVKKDPIITHTA